MGAKNEDHILVDCDVRTMLEWAAVRDDARW